MAYVDGFLLVVAKKNLEAYRRIARAAGKVWIGHGALEYRECVGDDLDPMPGMGTSFPKRVKLAPKEAVVFSWIIYKSRAQRDKVNAKVMADPRMQKLMDPRTNPMPLDIKRISVAGFDVIVDL
jgi:uncharacterized protein YbaA (DUF1428 family)